MVRDIYLEEAKKTIIRRVENRKETDHVELQFTPSIEEYDRRRQMRGREWLMIEKRFMKSVIPWDVWSLYCICPQGSPSPLRVPLKSVGNPCLRAFLFASGEAPDDLKLVRCGVEVKRIGIKDDRTDVTPDEVLSEVGTWTVSDLRDFVHVSPRLSDFVDLFGKQLRAGVIRYVSCFQTIVVLEEVHDGEIREVEVEKHTPENVDTVRRYTDGIYYYLDFLCRHAKTPKLSHEKFIKARKLLDVMDFDGVIETLKSFKGHPPYPHQYAELLDSQGDVFKRSIKQYHPDTYQLGM